MDKQSYTSDWIEKVKQWGYGDLINLMLDAIEPIAPVVAQGLWVVQPLAGIWNRSDTVQSLAEMLETPDGLAKLRQHLADDTQE